MQADGKVLVGGAFNATVGGSIGGATRNYIVRLDPVTGFADSFNPNAANSVYAIAVQPDGKIVAGGAFTSLTPAGSGTAIRNFIARVEQDGRIDATLIRGRTTLSVPWPCKPMARLWSAAASSSWGDKRATASDGSTPTARSTPTFNPGASGGGPTVDALAVQADGKIVVGGNFGQLGGQTRNRIGRLNPDGLGRHHF